MAARGTRAGFTLIEALLTLALFAVVVVKITTIIGSAGDANRDQSAAMALEDQARRVLDKIAYAVMSADREQLFPDPESPNFSTDVTYRMSMGVDEDGEVVWSDWERIGLSDDERQVVWTQNPDEAEERRVAWCNVIRPFFEGELPNGIDDNGNGLADELGLSFTLDRNAVTIRMSLEKPKRAGDPFVQSVETLVTCRN